MTSSCNYPISKYRPRGLIFERRFNRGFFSVTSLGAYTWRDLFSEFTGIYHDEFFILIIYMRVISCTFIFITMAKLMKNAIHPPLPLCPFLSRRWKSGCGLLLLSCSLPFSHQQIVIRVGKKGPAFQTKSL